MSNPSKKKKLVAVGISLALAAGFTAGGAFVTNSSTIFGNQFAASPFDTDESTKPDGEFIVTGDSMSHTFAGLAEDELVQATFVADNQAANGDVTFDLNSRVHAGNLSKELAGALNVRISVDGGAWIQGGTLAALTLGNSTVTVPAETQKTVRIEVYIADIDAYRAAGLENGAETTVDFLFDQVFAPNGV